MLATPSNIEGEAAVPVCSVKACAAAVGLWVGAQPAARLLFGWGRMTPDHVAQVAQWAAWGAWVLLPQALIAVAVLVLATVGRLRVAGWAFGGALAALAALGAAGLHDGRQVMIALGVILAVLALALLWSLGPRARQSLAWRDMAARVAFSEQRDFSEVTWEAREAIRLNSRFAANAAPRKCAESGVSPLVR